MRNPTVEKVALSDLARISSPFFAKCSGRSRDCLNPQGEFHGCSKMSMVRQKSSVASERQPSQLIPQ